MSVRVKFSLGIERIGVSVLVAMSRRRFHGGNVEVVTGILIWNVLDIGIDFNFFKKVIN